MFCSVGFPILFFPLLPTHADVHGKNNTNDQVHIWNRIEDVYIYIYIHSYTKKAVFCSPTQQSHPATTLKANKPQVGCQAITAVCTGSGAAKPGWLLPLCTEQGSAGLAVLLHWRLLSQATCTPGSWVITVTNKCCEKNSTYYFFQELPWHWCWF